MIRNNEGIVMVDFESIGVFIPEIDDRSEEEIYQQSLQVASNRSRGALNDFSDSNPLGVLARAQAFVSAELLYRVNKLPIAFALKLLELTGATRRLGQKSQASVTFYLTSAQATSYTIKKGFEVIGGSGRYSFFTDEQLVIPPGSVSGVVSCSAKEAGSEYNLPAYQITRFTQPLNFLASVTNITPSQGGAAEESVESAIERGLIGLRSRNPVSALDFEQRAESILGNGSKAKAIGLLGADKVAEQIGAVHLFLLASTGTPANAALINTVYSQMRQSIMLGTSLYISPMEQIAIEGEITVRIDAGVNPDVLSDQLWTEYQSYLAPSAYEPGATLEISELAYRLRLISGISLINVLELQGDILSIPMPNDYTLPQAHSLLINAIDPAGNIFVRLRGAGETANFNPQS